MSTPEGKIQNAICEHLQKHGVFFFRLNNQPTYDPKINSGRGGYRSQGKWAKPGVPDIIAIGPQGKFVGLEIKTPKSRQSADQMLFERSSKRAGADYYIIRSVKDVDNTSLIKR